MEERLGFIPAQMHYPTLWFLDLSFPAITKMLLKLDGVEISEHNRKILTSMKSKRVLYLSNHPTTIEPPVAFVVSNAMGCRFHYMASRNVFNWGFGMLGDIISKVGAFSVLAGGADKESIKTARSTLASPEGKLVIYPEGMCSGENDNLVPFMPGIAQIGFWGLEDAMKKDSRAEVYILPAFVKYVLSGSQNHQLQSIKRAISDIESKLGINPGTKNLLRRFLTAGRILLEFKEKEFNITPQPGQDYNYRVGKVRHELLNRAGAKLGIKFKDDENAIDKLRELFTLTDSFEAGIYDKKKYGILNPDYVQSSINDIQLAYAFIVLKPEYLVSYPSAERFTEWLYRFETVVFGKTELRSRKAVVNFATPFTLNEYYSAYKQDKKNGVKEVMSRLRKDMEAEMEKAIYLTKPIVTPFDAGPDLSFDSRF